MRHIYQIIIILLVLQGCGPILIGAVGGAVIIGVTQEKSLGSSVDDVTIWARLNAVLIEQSRFFDIKSRVDEGRVLLTGIVENDNARLEVIRLTWMVNGVREVIDEIIVNDESESMIRSSLITAQIKSKMIFTNGIKFINYTVVTVDNIVYLFGIAQDDKELNKVIKIASTVNGVEKVVSHVRLKYSWLRKL